MGIIIQIIMISEVNASEQKMLGEIKQIYQILIKYGFPEFVSSNILQNIADIQKYLSDYFQPTPKRQNLIDWLILSINTLYAQERQVKANKKRKMLNYLWRLGVLPFTKHTTNLDYEKYMDGLLGYESSINLIHNLCILLKESNQYSKSKQDSKFGGFLLEIIANYDTLVNVDYDPYNISFPAAYQNLSEQQFNSQYESTIKLIKLNTTKKNQLSKTDYSYEKMIKQFEQAKDEFQIKYQQFTQQIAETIQKKSILIQNSTNTSQCQRVPLKISQNLSKIYRYYKQKIKIARPISSKLADQRKHIQTLIESINDTVSL